MHAARVERALGGRIIGAGARDATEIEAREKPIKTRRSAAALNPSAPPPPKRGHPKKGEQRPAPEPTRLERQATQTFDQMRAELPCVCDVETKKQQGLQGELDRLQAAYRCRLRPDPGRMHSNLGLHARQPSRHPLDDADQQANPVPLRSPGCGL